MMRRFLQILSNSRYFVITPKNYYCMKEQPVNIVQFDFLKEKLSQKSITMIDVREPAELKDDGKIPNTVNIPLGEIMEAFKMSDNAFREKYGVSKPDFTTGFVLSCRSGKRATGAYEKLKSLGYGNISIYAGSFLDWVENGGPVEK